MKSNISFTTVLVVTEYRFHYYELFSIIKHCAETSNLNRKILCVTNVVDQKGLNTCKQTSEETSCSKTPREMTGKEVRITLNSSIYQSS